MQQSKHPFPQVFFLSNAYFLWAITDFMIHTYMPLHIYTYILSEETRINIFYTQHSLLWDPMQHLCFKCFCSDLYGCGTVALVWKWWRGQKEGMRQKSRTQNQGSSSVCSLLFQSWLSVPLLSMVPFNGVKGESPNPFTLLSLSLRTL